MERLSFGFQIGDEFINGLKGGFIAYAARYLRVVEDMSVDDFTAFTHRRVPVMGRVRFGDRITDICHGPRGDNVQRIADRFVRYGDHAARDDVAAIATTRRASPRFNTVRVHALLSASVFLESAKTKRPGDLPGPSALQRSEFTSAVRSACQQASAD